MLSPSLTSRAAGPHCVPAVPTRPTLSPHPSTPALWDSCPCRPGSRPWPPFPNLRESYRARWTGQGRPRVPPGSAHLASCSSGRAASSAWHSSPRKTCAGAGGGHAGTQPRGGGGELWAPPRAGLGVGGRGGASPWPQVGRLLQGRPACQTAPMPGLLHTCCGASISPLCRAGL